MTATAPVTTAPHRRCRAAAPTVVTGVIAVIAGGLVAAIEAHRPVVPLVWMSAYLVLVVGVAQIVFGAGQAGLARQVPGTGLVSAQWLLFNLGNTGVIGGTLIMWFPLVAVGTALFVVGIVLFFVGTRHSEHRLWRAGYWLLLTLLLVSSIVGLLLSAHG